MTSALKSVVLIGDSIRMAYQAPVRAQLAGQAEVWAPEDNGGNSRNVLAHLQGWVLARQPDIIHLNCGLHDLRKPFDADARAVPLDEYRANVRRILTRIQAGTEATVIWATTTPVNQARHHANKGFDRRESDVDAYNAAARTVAQELGVPVDDLFAVMRDAGPDAYLLEDGVHFNAAGSTLLDNAVAACIRRWL
jgi:lysophospholipase L1-like esterase